MTLMALHCWYIKTFYTNLLRQKVYPLCLFCFDELGMRTGSNSCPTPLGDNASADAFVWSVPSGQPLFFGLELVFSKQREFRGDKFSSCEIRWIPLTGMLRNLSLEAGINRYCLSAVCYNHLYPSCFSRRNPLGLIVALSDEGTAEGSIFWDDGEGIGKWSGQNVPCKYILSRK